MDPRPIGVFDSGVGGLSVVRALQAKAPAERIIYFADTAWFPYGRRPEAEVRKRAFAIARRLLDADCKLIVVACNTASAAALSDLRGAYPVPFIGMVPGLKPGLANSPSQHVAVLATEGTLRGELYHHVVQSFGTAARVVEVRGGPLAGLVEDGLAGTEEARAAVRKALGPAIEAGADTVVLGCTHYAFLAGSIEHEFPGTAIVDTSESVARHTLNRLCELELSTPDGRKGELDLIVTGDRERFREVMRGLGFSPERTGSTP